MLRNLTISRPPRKASPQKTPQYAVPASGETNVQALQKRLTERQMMLTNSIEGTNRELLRLKQEMAATKVGSASHKRYKERALRVVKQKRSLEKRLDATVDQLFNVTKISDARRTVRDAPHYAAVMEGSGNVDIERVTVDETDEAIEAMNETLRDIEEVGIALAQPYEDDMGDEEILKEIDELYEQMEGKKIDESTLKGLHYGIPDPPTDMPLPPSFPVGFSERGLNSGSSSNSRQGYRR